MCLALTHISVWFTGLPDKVSCRLAELMTEGEWCALSEPNMPARAFCFFQGEPDPQVAAGRSRPLIEQKN